jgi:hypothetical protein
MRPVQRSEILDWQTYDDQRDALRPAFLAAKRARRVQIGPLLCLLFENRETVRYQVQEMLRTERIVREAEVQHELDTYNELLGGDGELGCTLLIGLDDPAARDERLRRWKGLNESLYLKLPGGTKVRPRWDARQLGEDRLSSVQYLKFPLGGQLPLAAGCDHEDPELRGEVALTELQRGALEEDLARSE